MDMRTPVQLASLQSPLANTEMNERMNENVRTNDRERISKLYIQLKLERFRT